MIYEELAAAMAVCASDLEGAVECGKISLDMQIRAYDLLDRILEPGYDISTGEEVRRARERYLKVYGSVKDIMPSLFDGEGLKEEAERRMAPMREEMNNLRFEAASAASLHEFAKEVFEIWQTSGIFARRRALRELRERAGFRLESHRIGNYVAKTFDLMNEAQARFARSQQALFASDVKFKIRKDTYERIYESLIV